MAKKKKYLVIEEYQQDYTYSEALTEAIEMCKRFKKTYQVVELIATTKIDAKVHYEKV